MKEFIINLEENEVFVFGSNLAGRHGKGAAFTALKKFGAKHGQASGLMGKSYGIPTKDRNLNVLSLTNIESHVRRFLKFAKENPQLTFLVTEVGCGLAGYKPKQIAPLFFDNEIEISGNVKLPESFMKVYKEYITEKFKIPPVIVGVKK